MYNNIAYQVFRFLDDIINKETPSTISYNDTINEYNLFIDYNYGMDFFSDKYLYMRRFPCYFGGNFVATFFRISSKDFESDEQRNEIIKKFNNSGFDNDLILHHFGFIELKESYDEDEYGYLASTIFGIAEDLISMMLHGAPISSKHFSKFAKTIAGYITILLLFKNIDMDESKFDKCLDEITDLTGQNKIKKELFAFFSKMCINTNNRFCSANLISNSMCINKIFLEYSKILARADKE